MTSGVFVVVQTWMSAPQARVLTVDRVPISSTASRARVQPDLLETSADEVLCLRVLHGQNQISLF